MNKTSKTQGVNKGSKLDHQTTPQPQNKERGTMYKIIASIIFFGYTFITLNESRETSRQIAFLEKKQEYKKVIDYQQKVNETEIHCLARNMYFEARSEGTAGAIAVSAVVFNRVLSDKYPNSICGVIEEAKLSQWWLKEKGLKKPIKHMCQFSWYCDGLSDEIKDTKTYHQLYTLAKELFEKEDVIIDITDGATFYHATYVNPKWAKYKERTVKIGSHIFYRER